MAKSSTRDRGYGLLHRRFFDHPFWKEPRIFSKAEAWLDIVFCLARGLDDSKTGLKRGHFRASLSWLAKRWTWDKTKVQRFIASMTAGEDPMLERVVSEGPDVRIYRVCNFERYQNPKSANSMSAKDETPTDTPSETLNETPSETPKPAELLLFPATPETPSETPTDTPPETPSETNIKERNINTRKKNPPVVPPQPAKPERPKDSAFETFVETFDQRKAPAKYPRDRRADFVHLADLRRIQGVEARASPPEWVRTCDNYLDSPRKKHTLADLCDNYATFVHGRVDKFGNLIEGQNGAHSGNGKPDSGAAAGAGGKLTPRPYTPKQ